MKHLRPGDILVEVKKESHYSNLMKTTMLVKVSPHKTLNNIKGVIRCNTLRSTPQEDILENLLDQGVSKVHKIVINKEGN